MLSSRLLLMLLVVAAAVIHALIVRARKKPFQFSLRGLFIALTIVALLLGCVSWWRISNLAKVQWLDPTAAAAIALFPPSEVVRHDEGWPPGAVPAGPTSEKEVPLEHGWALDYRSQRRGISGLIEILRQSGDEIRGDYGFEQDLARINIIARDRESLEEYLAALQSADKLGPGEMVIRGRVDDSDGMPLAGAHVNLMDGGAYISQAGTRSDGTFVLPTKSKEGWKFHLRIHLHPRDGKPRDTRRFSLNYDDPERVVIVRLP